jgi:hypothetical protein
MLVLIKGDYQLENEMVLGIKLCSWNWLFVYMVMIPISLEATGGVLVSNVQTMGRFVFIFLFPYDLYHHCFYVVIPTILCSLLVLHN